MLHGPPRRSGRRASWEARHAASPARPTGAHPPGALPPRRDLALGWSLLTLIAALAWVLTVARFRDMGMQPGTVGVTLPLFLLLWS